MSGVKVLQSRYALDIIHSMYIFLYSLTSYLWCSFINTIFVFITDGGGGLTQEQKLGIGLGIGIPCLIAGGVGIGYFIYKHNR